jgi:diketogulonate reductase-like aldo/keto reductase
LSSAAGVLASPWLPATAATAPAFSAQPGFKLNTGVNFPSASFGLQIYDDDTAYKLTRLALDVGYRNFFASVLARNQRGFARAVKDSGVPREDLFICGSVLSNRVQGYDAAFKLSKRGCEQNMEAFAAGGLDYIDMIMLDYPGPDAESIRGQWAALEEMQTAKLTRSVAVSNFSAAQLDAVLGMGKGVTVPAVNQLPYGVGFAGYYGGKAAEVIAENRKRGVLVQAWSPLGRALSGDAKKACEEIGKKYGKTAAQVALRFIVDTGATFTTQTKSKSHFQEDLDIFDFQLSADEVALLAKL